MPPIDRVGLYEGKIADCGIALTRKAKLPQFIVTFVADRMLNEATGRWDDWQYEQTITGYFVLVTLNEHGEPIKCLNYDQVMEATGWDGETYSGLAAMDLKDHRIQIRVTSEDYNGTPTLKANWIAAEGARIGLQTLTGQDLTDLDAKFGVAPTTTKPATAAKPKPATAAAPTPPKTEAPKPPAALPPKAPTTTVNESCTETDAYQACITANTELGDKAAPQEVLDDYWINNAIEIAADVNNVTSEEWAKIRDATLNDIQIPF